MYVSAKNFASSNIKRAYHSQFSDVNRQQSPCFRGIRKKTLFLSVFLNKWRMRRDLNPRYESPRIHDFESRAFSLSATHP